MLSIERTPIKTEMLLICRTHDEINVEFERCNGQNASQGVERMPPAHEWAKKRAHTQTVAARRLHQRAGTLKHASILICQLVRAVKSPSRAYEAKAAKEQSTLVRIRTA
eukprot:1779080-Pleurochrysis_carterae.AAC.1